MRFAIYGLVFAALVFLVSGGHLRFLPLFFVLPLGGMFGHHQRPGTSGIAQGGENETAPDGKDDTGRVCWAGGVGDTAAMAGTGIGGV